GIRRSVPYGLASRYRSKDVRDSLTSLRSEDDEERIQRNNFFLFFSCFKNS
ncbi:unnamed protein product, partial [Rotaria magnacalcarata]